MTRLDGGTILRPYEGLEPFASVLRGLEVQVRNQGFWISEDNIQLRLEDFQPLGLAVRWAWDDDDLRTELRDAVDGASLFPEDVTLLGMLRCPQTKTLRSFIEIGLEELLSQHGLPVTSIPVDERPRILPNRDVTLEFYLLLNRSIPDNFPYPHRKGTWLSQKMFTVQSSLNDSFDFHWADLNDEIRIAKQLHKDSVMFVDNKLPMHEADRFSDCVDAYVDSEHQAAVRSHGSSPLGKYLQASMVREVVSQSLLFTLEELKKRQRPPSWAEMEGQPILGRLCRTFASNGNWALESPDAEGVYEKLLSSPTLVNEYLDDLFGIRKLAKSLQKAEA